MKSVMSHSFSRVPSVQIPRSSFDRSCGLKTTFDSGWLIPVFVDEALPGDTFNLSMTAFTRLATPIHPFMDNIHLDSFFFAVPIRLIWDNFQKFNGEQTNPGDSTDFVIPTTIPPTGGYLNGSLSDYFGIPTGVEGIEHSALWHRAYNLIFNEWFRDQNLIDSLEVKKDDGPDTPGSYTLQKRGKRHDYFTSALPWPQKGDAVELPIGDSAPLNITSTGVISVPDQEHAPTFWDKDTDSYVSHHLLALDSDPAVNIDGVSGSSQGGILTWNDPNLDVNVTSTGTADLSAATAITINQLRQGFQVQRMFERDARGGSRYTEIIRSHFGVVSPDSRLQRPEYLGGGTSRININPVAQTSGAFETAESPQGNLAAFGVGGIQGHGFTKSFTEHCVIIGLVSARADLTYQQGLDRMFSRSTRFDYYWPSLSHLGEQAILNKEIYAQGTADPTVDEAVFGYQERYAEYRYKQSKITGQFRSNFAQTLDSWHLSQNFADLPLLNETFIQETPPIERVLAVQDEPEFLFDSYFSLKCARPMPTFSVPGMIDHF